MYRKVTAERAVLDRLLDRLGDVDYGSPGAYRDSNAPGLGNGQQQQQQQKKKRAKSQCIILEGRRWSALVLARAASPLPMPGIEPEMRARLAEQYRLYELQQQEQQQAMIVAHDGYVSENNNEHAGK